MQTLRKVFNTTMLSLMAAVASLSAAEAENDAVRYLDVEVSNLVLTSETNSGKVVYAAPGELIQGEADCVIHRPQYAYELTQAIIGFDGIGAQDGLEEGYFTLTAPQKTGIYEVRFRYAQAYSLEEAIEYWWGVDSTPPWQATVGLVIVSEDPKNDPREINGSNWKQWLSKKYASDQQISDDVEVIPTLTSEMVNGAEFWDAAKTTGKWVIDGSVFSNKGTKRYNKYHQIVSTQLFQDFNLNVTEEYQYTNNKETEWWSHSRGFGILYYVNENANVEFRYFADIGQLSLYIRDDKKVIELMQPAYFEPGTPIVHDITVKKGKIKWKVNGELIFKETTTLQQGRLMLTNHNNATTFRF